MLNAKFLAKFFSIFYIMKQHIFKQNLLTKLLAVMLAVIMVVVAACNKESFYTKSIDNNVSAEAKRSDAQQWFESQQTISTSTYLKTMKPNWNTAIAARGVVHVSIQFDSGRHHIPSLYKGTAYLGREKLVLYEKAGKYTGLIVDFMPSKVFKGNIDLLNVINFKEQKFDGTILVKNLDGEYAHAIEVESGQVTRRLVNKAVVPVDNAPEELVCITYFSWRCYQPPWGCCCLECQMVSRTVCWTANSGAGGSDCPSPNPACPTDGCPGDYSWCFDDQTGGGGGGSIDMVWIRNNQLGAFETLLISNQALLDAVKRFILNTGDYTLFSPIVANYLLYESNLSLIAKHLQLLADNGDYFSYHQQEGFTVTAMNRTLKSQVLDGSGTLNSGTCAESFLYIRVGDGFTTGVKGMGHAYLKNFTWYDVCISNMCIQVRGKDQFNQPLTADKAAELTAYAFDNARLEMFEDLNNVITTSEQARNLYKTYVQDELAKLTGYRGSCSISYGECSGNVPAEFYYLKGLLTGFQCYHTGRCP
jgi:hypothetical protein